MPVIIRDGTGRLNHMDHIDNKFLESGRPNFFLQYRDTAGELHAWPIHIVKLLESGYDLNACEECEGIKRWDPEMIEFLHVEGGVQSIQTFCHSLYDQQLYPDLETELAGDSQTAIKAMGIFLRGYSFAEQHDLAYMEEFARELGAVIDEIDINLSALAFAIAIIREQPECRGDNANLRRAIMSAAVRRASAIFPDESADMDTLEQSARFHYTLQRNLDDYGGFVAELRAEIADRMHDRGRDE